MDILNLLKELLNIDVTDVSKDTILNFYIKKAKNAIMKYCVLTEEEFTSSKLDNQNIELAMYYYQNRKNLGVKSGSEGNKSKSFEYEGIPISIKETLPLPKVKLM